MTYNTLLTLFSDQNIWLCSSVAVYSSVQLYGCTAVRGVRLLNKKVLYLLVRHYRGYMIHGVPDSTPPTRTKLPTTARDSQNIPRKMGTSRNTGRARCQNSTVYSCSLQPGQGSQRTRLVLNININPRQGMPVYGAGFFGGIMVGNQEFVSRE